MNAFNVNHVFKFILAESHEAEVFSTYAFLSNFDF